MKKNLNYLLINLLTKNPSPSIPLPRRGKKAAFTLAKVLITLGIIGVVAALTLPPLIANYQKQVFVNKLKKEYGLLNTVFKNMILTEGVTSLSDTEAFRTIGDSGCKYLASYQPNCTEFYDLLSKYIKFTPYKLTKTYESSTFDDSNTLSGYDYTNSVMLLADGFYAANYKYLPFLLRIAERQRSYRR